MTARPVLSEEDVRAAQVALDTWVEALEGRVDPTTVTTAAALELRGILAAQFAEVRAAGYLEGHTAATDLATGLRECPVGPGDHAPTMGGTCALCGQVLEL